MGYSGWKAAAIYNDNGGLRYHPEKKINHNIPLQGFGEVGDWMKTTVDYGSRTITWQVGDKTSTNTFDELGLGEAQVRPFHFRAWSVE